MQDVLSRVGLDGLLALTTLQWVLIVVLIVVIVAYYVWKRKQE